MSYDNEEWFVQKNGKNIGPFTLKKLVELYSKGKINEKILVKQTNDGEWVELQSIVEFDLLFSIFDGPSVSISKNPVGIVAALAEPKKVNTMSKSTEKKARSIDAGHIVVFVSAGLFLLSLGLPWFDMILVSIPGYRTSAIILFIFFIPGLITSFCRLPIPFIFGGLQGVTIVAVLIIVILNFMLISAPFGDDDRIFNATGFGLYVAIFSGLGLILGACLHLYVSVPDSLDEVIKG